ncbi:MAG: hypothetical protein ACJ8DU_08670 [Microvirga sp.]
MLSVPIVVRVDEDYRACRAPLELPVPCTLGLIAHRKNPKEPALAIVREALVGLNGARATLYENYRRLRLPNPSTALKGIFGETPRPG